METNETRRQVHAGAKLKGGFSRMDYMASKHADIPNPSFRKLEAVLPTGARRAVVASCLKEKKRC